MLAARLYDANGKVFADYRRSDVSPQFKMPAWREQGAEFTPDALTLFRAVSLNGEKAGTIGIVSDLTGLRLAIW